MGSLTDQQVMEQIQYSMIEPPDLGQTWPSELWDMEEVVGYLNQRQDRFLRDTHMQVGIADIPIVAGVVNYPLPGDWLDTVRVLFYYKDNSVNRVRPLGRADSFQADHGYPNWFTQEDIPKIYDDSTTAPLTINIMPSPDRAGKIQVYYIPVADSMDGGGVALTVPDEFVPHLKYGVMADMLYKPARGQDASRAEYCNRRYELGLEIAKMLLLGWKSK